MINNYVCYHLHTHYSNTNGYADSCTDYTDYIKLAKQQGMKAIAFSEHGNIGDWIKKKQECDKNQIKYIHGCEAYVCVELSDNDRGGHIGLYAKNWNGVLELNNLISLSTSKGDLEDNSDRHAYYNPRISLNELMSTSDNIIVTSACLASPLNKWNIEDEHYQQAFRTLLKWMAQNKHRCFLEIQYHNCPNQIEYNKKIYLYSQRTGIPLIAGTDTHSSSQYKAECRKILQIYKDSFYGEEDEFDLVWKTYDELVESFKLQNALPDAVYLEAINNTNKFADMFEDYTLDKSFKYPTLYGDNVREQWQKLIVSSLNNKIKNNELFLPSKIKERCEQYFATHHIDSNSTELEKQIYQTYEHYKEWYTTYTDKEIIQQYKIRIAEEYNVMCKLGMESFMMFMSELIKWAKSNDIPCGTGRGSVCGSEIAFITDITDVDPMVWNTVFSRFCNVDRISLGDIDVDFAGEDRPKVFQYIIDRFTPKKTAYIAAFQTLKTRGCIDALAGGLGYEDLNKVAEIKNQYDEYYANYSKVVTEEIDVETLAEDGVIDDTQINFDYHDIYLNRIVNSKAKEKLILYKQAFDNLINSNQDLFYYLDGLKNTIVSKGVHPSGIIGSPITLANNIGLWYKDGDTNTPVSSCAMKAVDSLNYVKFDILGLKTVGIIKDACKYANIPYPKSAYMNWDDINVWQNMITAQQGVFQFEGDYAFKLLSDFKPNNINHMSMVNAALRPSGKSYRDKLIAGEKNVNPSKEIDDLLAGNNGYLIFQEDTIKFLTDICGFTGSAADTTRRAIGKKDKELLEQQLPKIIEGYCQHSSQPKDVATQEAKQFVQIIQDSSDYQFGYNHSTAYSMNGYECVWLRTYYPIEFVTAYLNRAQDEKDIVNGTMLAKLNNITIHNIKFGKSSAEYTPDIKNCAIYKGIASIKYCNNNIADELLELSKNHYNNFITLLKDIKEKTSVDARQLKILIGLNFFSEFGKNKYLMDIVNIYNKFGTCKIINKNNLEEFNNQYGLTELMLDKYCGKSTAKQYREIDNKGLIKALCEKLENKSLSISEQIKFEDEMLGYIDYVNSKVPEYFWIVTEFKVYDNNSKPYLTLRNIHSGETVKTRIKKAKIFDANPFELYSILIFNDFSYENKSRKVDGKWIKIDEKESVLNVYEVLKGCE